jgi:hypothetical protein
MKTKKVISAVILPLFAMVLFLIVGNSCNQSKKEDLAMKDCCMMKDGKMMVMKDGKTMPMDKTMTMSNGTSCMTNGQCTMKDGSTMMMKEGDCMETNGEMCTDKMKMMEKNKTPEKEVVAVYTCPMHPEVIGIKGGKCPKCGMDLVKK